MAVDALYDAARQAFLAGDLDWDAHAFKAVLVDLADYTPNLATHQFLSDVPAAARVGTPQTLANTTVASGVADADDVAFPSVTGDPCEAVLVYRDTGVEATSRLVCLITGRFTVTCAEAALAGATAIRVDPLKEALPSGATLAFSGGTTATLSAAASAGARSVSVAALPAGVAAGETAEGAYASGLPVTPTGGNLTVAWNAAGIFRL